MKKILLTVMLALAAFTISAQTESKGKTRWSIGLDAGLPVGAYDDVFSVGLGGTVKAEFPVATKAFATISGGYTSLSYTENFKDITLTDERAVSFVPLKAGIKYFLGTNFYGSGEMGAAIGTSRGWRTAFAWAPGIGISYPVSNNKDIDAGVRYEGWSKNNGTIAQIGFHIALKF